MAISQNEVVGGRVVENRIEQMYLTPRSTINSRVIN